MSEEHYLKRELYRLIAEDEGIFDFLANNILDGVWYWDLDHIDQEWLNPRFMNFFGFEEGEMAHSPEWWQANIHPDDLQKALENFEAHKADPDHPYDQVVRYRHRNGETVWVRCKGLIVRNKDGRPIRMLGVHMDVTDLKRTEAEFLDATDRYKLVMDGIVAGVWDWIRPEDRQSDGPQDEDTLYLSPRYYELLEYEDREIIGTFKTMKASVHSDDHDRVIAFLQTCFTSDSPVQTDYRLCCKSGAYRWFQGTAIAAQDSDGKPRRVVGSIIDIHDLKSAQAKLDDQSRQLERSNRELQQFAYVASHDLKAPLRGIGNLASWIEEDLADTMSAQTRENMDLLKGRIARLENLLDDLLAYSRVGRDQSKVETVELAPLLQREFDLLGQSDRFDLQLDLDQTSVCLQPAPFSAVIRNLLSNALKHHDKTSGHIRIGLRTEAEQYTVSIEDDGPGIAPDFHERIFGMFQALQPRDKVEGSGMGLAIVRKQVEAFGGRIWLRSDPALKRGAIFYFTWPKNT